MILQDKLFILQDYLFSRMATVREREKRAKCVYHCSWEINSKQEDERWTMKWNFGTG